MVIRKGVGNSTGRPLDTLNNGFHDRAADIQKVYRSALLGVGGDKSVLISSRSSSLVLDLIRTGIHGTSSTSIRGGDGHLRWGRSRGVVRLLRTLRALRTKNDNVQLISQAALVYFLDNSNVTFY